MKNIFSSPLLLQLIFFFLLAPPLRGKEVLSKKEGFSLDTFKELSPNSSLLAIQKKFGKGEIIFDKGKSQTYKFSIIHKQYRFPVFITFFKEVSLSLFAKLPSYFLHDTFHRELIQRYGKQNSYSKKDNAAVYSWNLNSGIRIDYQGSCTITCFPVYFQMYTTKPPQDFTGNLNLIDEFNERKF